MMFAKKTSSNKNNTTPSEQFYRIYKDYIDRLRENGESWPDIQEAVKEPLNVPRQRSQHLQNYLNLNSMLYPNGLLTSMAATGIYDIDLEDLITVIARCINELEHAAVSVSFGIK